MDKTKKIVSGTFGNCYLAVYCNDFRFVVKEMKAAAITGIGDHWGIPHLFGVCTKKVPHYLVLQFHASGFLSPTESTIVRQAYPRKTRVSPLFGTCNTKEALSPQFNIRL